MENTVDDILQKFVLPITESGCWIWMGALNPAGYGVVSFRNKRQLAHRLLFTETLGPIPPGLPLDHLCRVRCCVNPKHLELVTHAENSARGNARKRTHCPHGHPYSGENLYIYRRDGSQLCRQCRRDGMRRRNGYKGNLPQKQRTHCPQGHEYTPENTFYLKQGWRHCRECGRQSHREWARRLAATKPRQIPKPPPSRGGIKHTPESKTKMSAAKLGKKHTPETRAKMSKSRLGHPVSQETKTKIGAANLGKKRTPEVRAKMSKAKLGLPGHPCSSETRAKISLANRKKGPGSETGGLSESPKEKGA